LPTSLTQAVPATGSAPATRQERGGRPSSPTPPTWLTTTLRAGTSTKQPTPAGGAPAHRPRRPTPAAGTPPPRAPPPGPLDLGDLPADGGGAVAADAGCGAGVLRAERGEEGDLVGARGGVEDEDAQVEAVGAAVLGLSAAGLLAEGAAVEQLLGACQARRE